MFESGKAKGKRKKEGVFFFFFLFKKGKCFPLGVVSCPRHWWDLRSLRDCMGAKSKIIC